MIDDRDVEMLEHRFDDRYRKIDDCTEIMGGYDDKLDLIAKNQVATNTRLGILIGILTTIAVPIIGVCVSLLFGK